MTEGDTNQKNQYNEEIISRCGDCAKWLGECRPQGVEKNDPVGTCAMFQFGRKGFERISKSLERERKKKKPPILINISDLLSNKVGKLVKCEVQITGQKDQKALPRVILASCPYCEKSVKADLIKNKKAIEDIIFRNKKDKEIAGFYLGKYTCSRKAHYAKYKCVSYMDFALIHVRDILHGGSKFDENVCRDKKIYLINQKIPKVKKIKLVGNVIVEPGTRNITILADKIEPKDNEIKNFIITESDKENWNKYFNDINVLKNQISPDTVGQKRDIAKKTIVLTLHSPSTILDINGNEIRGGLRPSFYGDTKTNKSTLGKDITGLLPSSYRFGEFIVGESSSRAGITYFIDTESKALIWGALVLNDLGLLVIDGMQAIHSSEMQELREALEQNRIVVRRSQSGEALCRTRILGCFNPRKAMDEYLYPCIGLSDTYIFSNPPDITRWDIFIPFLTSDVPKEEIANRKLRKRVIPDDIFIRHVYWVWSRKAEQILYLPEAIDLIKGKSVEIMKDYELSSLPIVHNGFREVITRISVAVAASENSVDESYECIIVKGIHVIKALDFYEETLKLLGLKEYVIEERGTRTITQSEFEEINRELEEREYEILDLIKLNVQSSNTLAEKLGVSVATIKRSYEKLKKYNLIKTSTGKGAKLNVRGVKFLRYLKGENQEIVSKSDTMIPDNYYNKEKYNEFKENIILQQREKELGIIESKSDTNQEWFNKFDNLETQLAGEPKKGAICDFCEGIAERVLVNSGKKANACSICIEKLSFSISDDMDQPMKAMQSIIGNQPEPSFSKVRIKEDIPEFIDPTNGTIIHRLYKDDLVALPNVVANILVRRKVAERVQEVE